MKKILLVLWTVGCILFGIGVASPTGEHTEYNTDFEFQLNQQMQFEVFQPEYSIEAASCYDFQISLQGADMKLEGMETSETMLGWPCEKRFYASASNQRPGIWVVDWVQSWQRVTFHVTSGEVIRITQKFNHRAESMDDYVSAVVIFIVWILMVALGYTFTHLPKQEGSD